MINIEFNKCKTVKDVEKVFKTQKDLLDLARNQIKKLLRLKAIRCPDCKGEGSTFNHNYKCSFLCGKCSGFGLVNK